MPSGLKSSKVVTESQLKRQRFSDEFLDPFCPRFFNTICLSVSSFCGLVIVMTPDDMTLVQEYVATRSEAAFAALVQRHIHHVHSAAMRQVGNPHLAEEITQSVFVNLAQKAAKLRRDAILSAWLHRAVYFAAHEVLRAQRRRQIREQEAYMQSTLNDAETENVWPQLAPFLDGAMNELAETDRAALMLRYFENKTAKEIARALRVKEDAAQKRIVRGLVKLRTIFLKHGVTLSAATIAGAISANSVQTAPAALIKATTAVALAKSATVSTSTIGLVKGALKIMAWTKAQTAVIGLVTIGIATYSVIQHQTQSRLREQNESLQQQVNQLSQLKTENENLSNQLAAAKRWAADARAPLDTASQKPSQPVQAPIVSPVQPAAPVKTAVVELPKSSWTNAGFATPEAALRTRGAAVLNGDRDLFKQSIFIPDDARKFAEDAFIKMAEASNDPNKAQYLQSILDNKFGVDEGILMPMMAQNQNSGMSGYKILSEQPVSLNEQVLQVETDVNSGSSRTETLDFQLIDGNWRVVYDKATFEKMMQH